MNANFTLIGALYEQRENDKTFAQYGKIAIEKLLEKVSALDGSARKTKILEEIISKIKTFEQRLMTMPFDKNPDKAKDEELYVLGILSLCSTVSSTFNGIIQSQ